MHEVLLGQQGQEELARRQRLPVQALKRLGHCGFDHGMPRALPHGHELRVFAKMRHKVFKYRHEIRGL